MLFGNSLQLHGTVDRRLLELIDGDQPLIKVLYFYSNAM